MSRILQPPKVHHGPAANSISRTTCGMRASFLVFSLDWNRVTCGRCRKHAPDGDFTTGEHLAKKENNT